MITAPVVRIRRTGRHVFLIAWERDKNGRWRGHVAWRGVDVWMPADDLEQVAGEDYRRVPRYIAHDTAF